MTPSEHAAAAYRWLAKADWSPDDPRSGNYAALATAHFAAATYGNLTNGMLDSMAEAHALANRRRANSTPPC